MDLDPPGSADPFPGSRSSKSPQAILPSRKQSQPKERQSPSKGAAPKSISQLEDQQMQKFSDYMDEVLDGEENSSSDFFIQPASESYSSSCNGPLLTPSCMRRINKAVRGLVKSSSGKRVYEQGVDVDQMTRLLAILQRSVEAAENLSIVPAAAKAAKSREKKFLSRTPKKSDRSKKGDNSSPLPKARRRSSRSATPASYREDEDDDKSQEEESEDEEQPETPMSQSRPKLNKRASTTSASKGRKGSAGKAGLDTNDDFEWDEQTLEALQENLTVFKNAVTATDTVMILLGSASLPKQLYSEDLINLCLIVLKTHLASVIYPALDPERSPLGSGQLDESVTTLIRKVLTAASSAFASITTLLKQEDATDATLINAVYIAIAPFFSEPSVKNKAKDVSGSLEMKVVRSQALAIIRCVGKYASNRECSDLTDFTSDFCQIPRAEAVDCRRGSVVHHKIAGFGQEKASVHVRTCELTSLCEVTYNNSGSGCTMDRLYKLFQLCCCTSCKAALRDSVHVCCLPYTSEAHRLRQLQMQTKALMSNHRSKAQ